MIAIAAFTVRQLIRQRFVIAAVLVTVVLAALTDWGFYALRNAHGPNGRPISQLELKATASILVILVAYLFSFILAAAPTLPSLVRSNFRWCGSLRATRRRIPRRPSARWPL